MTLCSHLMNPHTISSSEDDDGITVNNPLHKQKRRYEEGITYWFIVIISLVKECIYA